MRTSTSLSFEYRPAATNTYDSSRALIDRVVIHTMDGFLDGTAAWFANVNRENNSSCHYGIGFDGRIQQYVYEDKTSYHAGHYPTNQRSIGIEHEDQGKPNDPRPELLYQTSAKLIADICNFYSIPIDREHIIKHNEVPGVTKVCPGTLDIDKLVEMSKTITNTTEAILEYKMTESVFIGLVKKSRNFDDVADYIGLSQESRLDPKAGESVVNYIKEIQNKSEELLNKANAMLDAVEAQKEIPGKQPSVLEEILPQSNEVAISTTDNSVPNAIETELDTIERGKTLLFGDLKNVWKLISSWFWS